MRVFGALIALNFKDLASFQFDALSKLAGYPIQFGLLLVLWISLAHQGADIDLAYLSSYYAISFALLAQYPFLRMAMRTQDVVLNGDYVKNMISGISLPLEYLAEFCSRALWFNLFSMPCAVAIAHISTGLPFQFTAFGALFVSVFLGGVIQVLFWMLIGLSAFWLVVNSGLIVAFQHIQRLLTGAIIPLSMLPLEVQQLLAFSPFPYSLYLPVHTYLTDSVGYLSLIPIQLIWCLGLWGAVQLIYLRGIARADGAMA